MRARYEALLTAEKEAVAELLAKLEEPGGAFSDNLMLHRMMLPPSHGTGAAGRVDLKPRRTRGSVSASIQLPATLLEETHDYMFTSAHVAHDTGCFSFPASLAR